MEVHCPCQLGMRVNLENLYDLDMYRDFPFDLYKYDALSSLGEKKRDLYLGRPRLRLIEAVHL